MNHALDVALITLLDGDLVKFPEHLGVAYLAAELRQHGRTAEVFSISPLNEAEAIARIVSARPRVVGFSLTTASFLRATRIGQQLREALGAMVHMTAGGPLVTSLGVSLLRNPSWEFLDSAVRGEGEVPMIHLLDALSGGGDLSTVPSLCYRNFAGVACNPMAASVTDLNRFTVPARDQVECGPQATARIATSRGCTSRCAFCNAPHAGNTLAGKVWRGRSPESVVDEMEAIYRGMGVRDFEFVDSTFEDPGGTAWAKQRIASIARLILDRGLNITFGCCVQSQNWRAEDLWLIDLLRRAGLQRVLMGVESGSAATLKRWNKKATPEDNRRAIALFRSRSVYVNMGFIMFHPHSTRSEVVENLAFLRSAGAHTLRPLCTRMEIYPGTASLESLRNDGLLLPEYDQTLNPFAYRFLDGDIERLAYAMALLTGEDYARTGAVDVLPPHLEFVFLDMAIHAKTTARLRSGRTVPGLRDFMAEYRSLCAELSAFNLDVFAAIADRIFSGESAQRAAAGHAGRVRRFYTEKIAVLSGLYQDCINEQTPLPAPVLSPISNSMAGAQ